MKTLSRRQLNETGFMVIEVIAVVLVLVAIGVAGYLVYRHHSQAAGANQGSVVSFDTQTGEIADDACALQTDLGCFYATGSQLTTLSKFSDKGYAVVHIEGRGYTDYETPTIAPIGKPQKIKVLHVTHIDSIKGVGQKFK